MKLDKSIVLKISGASLKNSDDNSIFDKQFINKFIKTLKTVICEKKTKIILVIGGGNIWRGSYDKRIDSNNSDYMGMISTIINAIYLKELFIIENIRAAVLSELEIPNLIKKFSYDKYLSYEYNKRPDLLICCAGTGKPGYSTDTAAILKAINLNIKTVLFAKNNVDGIYNKDPNKYKNTKFYPNMSYNHALKLDIKVIDKKAIILSQENQLNLYIFNFNNPTNILSLYNNKIRFSKLSNSKE